MRILIIDDSKNKNNWIRAMLEKENIEYDELTYFNEAYSHILNNTELYDGIILDMQFPILKDSPIQSKSGEYFLKKLKNRKINIPVLGNSMIKFSNTEQYPFFKGNTNGYQNPKMLEYFLESI